MNSTEMKSALSLILKNLPSDWMEAEIIYRSFDGATDLTEKYRSNDDNAWVSFDAGGFDLMDILDSHHNGSSGDNWTKIHIILKKGADPDVTYGYGNQNILG